MNQDVTTNIYNRMLNSINNKIDNTTIKKIDIVKSTTLDGNILWTQLLLHDGGVLPIKIDILTKLSKIPTKAIYLLPGTGLNVESNFIIPTSNSIATFLANKYYLVIGITPREDSAPPDFNVELMKDWGLHKHTDDVNKVINLFQSIYNMQYEVLGHSGGALIAFNHASITSNRKLKTIRIIDVVGEYSPISQKFNNAQVSLNAANQLLSSGTFVITDIAGVKYLSQLAQTDPNGDSGVPRPVPGGNFTNIGLLHFSLIFTGQLPGILTPITGLPGSWFLEQGFLAGTYDFGATPTDDTFTLTHTNINTIFSAVPTIGSGIYPMAYERDIYALLINSFPLAWQNIKAPVFYLNAALGFGEASYTISLLTNSIVSSALVQDYGHADCVYSDTARTDFWNILIPP